MINTVQQNVLNLRLRLVARAMKIRLSNPLSMGLLWHVVIPKHLC